jgi:hypothetical protein
MKEFKMNRAKKPAIWRLLVDRKNFFISPQFQRHFILYVMSITLVSLALFYISQQYFFHQFYQSGEQLGLPSGHPYFQLLKDQQGGLSKIFFITSSLIACFILFSALFFSHRIAGPLYRLEQYFKNASHDPSLLERPLAFREDDFFQELPDSINLFMYQHKLNKPAEEPPMVSREEDTQKKNSKAS